jgi:PAS domain S-box-containing protein
MPDFSAQAALLLLQHNHLDIPFIIASGTISEETAIDLMRAGAADYLMKDRLARLGALVKRELNITQVRRERQEAQAALQVSQDWAKLIYNTTSDAMFLLAIEPGNVYRFLTVNAAYLDALGFSEAGVVGKRAEEVLPVPIADFVFSKYQKAIQARCAIQYEETIELPRGPVFIETNLTPIFDSGGKCTHLLGALRDITKRKLAEKALRKDELFLRTILQTTKDGFCLLDGSGKIMDANQAYSEMSGYTLAELKGLAITDIDAEEDSAAAAARVRRIMENGSEQFETRHRKKGGELIDVEISTTYLTEDGGRFICFCRDITERKQVEQVLRASEQNFREIFNSTSEAIFIHDAETGQILDVNDSMIKSYTYDNKEQVLSKTIGDLSANESPFANARAEAYVRNAIRVGPQVFEWLAKRRDGSKFWVEISLRRSQIAGKDRVLAVVRDISERKKAEDTLRLSEEKFSTAFHISPDSININRLSDGLYIEINQGFTALTGYTSDDVLGKTSAELNIWVNPQDREKMVKGLLGQGEVWNLESTFRTKNGNLKICLISARIIELNQEQCILSITHDISERKRAEELMTRQSEQLRILYEASQKLNRTLDLHEIYQTVCDFMSMIAPNDGFFISDFDNETRLITCRAYWMDNTWMDVSGFPSIPLEEEGKGTQSIVIRTGQPMLINDYQEQVKTAQSVYYVNDETHEIVTEISPDEDVTRSALIVPLKVGGRVTGVIQVMSCRLNAYAENQLKMLEALALHIASAEQNAQLYGQVQMELNERKRAEGRVLQLNNDLERRVRERTAQLEAANQELETFSYSVSHDLRSPLRSILGFSDILQTDYSNQLDPQGVNYLNRIQESAHHMGQLINDLLNLSGIFKADFMCRQVNLSAMAHEIASELQESNPKRQVEFEIADNLAAICDANLIRIAMNNLLDNAYKYSSKQEKAQITVAAIDQANEHIYYVRDNGAGFDMAYADKLFTPFQRLHSAKEYKGTGIGLSIVQRVIHRHGGRIWAEAKKGQGTTFYFTLGQPLSPDNHS